MTKWRPGRGNMLEKLSPKEKEEQGGGWMRYVAIKTEDQGSR